MQHSFNLSAAVAAALVFHSFALPVLAQPKSVQELHADLQTAVCLNDWDQAIALSSQLIVSNLTSASREEMVDFRYQLQDLRATRTTVNLAGCEEVARAALVESSEAQQVSRPLDWGRAVASIGGSTHRTATQPIQEPSGSVGMAGYTCDDFSTWGEAEWHFLTGTAPGSLDGDGDLIACEGLPTTPRTGGTRTWGTSSNSGLSVTLYRAGVGDYYMRVSASPVMDPFTTRSFSSGEEAIQHWERYYEGRLDGLGGL